MHADEDNKRKGVIEARNNADNTAYTAEKLLRDNGDKIDDAMKSQVNDLVAKVREAMAGEDADAIRKQTEELSQAIQKDWCEYVSAARRHRSGCRPCG